MLVGIYFDRENNIWADIKNKYEKEELNTTREKQDMYLMAQH